MQRLEARFFRIFGQNAAFLLRLGAALLLLWSGATGIWSPRSSFQNAPLDWASQALSILSVGRITFAAAPKIIGGFELFLALSLSLWPRSRVLAVGLLLRLVLAMLPLFMLRDDLWSAFPLRPSGAGWGVVGQGCFLGATFFGATRARWKWLQSQHHVVALLLESPAQIAARRRLWTRFGLVFGPLFLVMALAFPLVWPHYLRWFHARQEAGALGENLQGTLIKKSMPPSAILGGRKISTWVYLPPGYNRGGARFPVVYVMHGMPGEVRDCFVKGQIQDAAEKLITTGQIRPLILVGWDGQGPGGPNDVTNYLDRPDYPMETFIRRELVPYVDKTYKTLPKAEFRALDGISAGGYAAPNLVFKYPNLWKIAASHNGFYSPIDDAENMTAILGRRGPKWDENDPTRTVEKLSAANGLHVYLDIGQGDELQAEFSRFARQIKARGLDCSAQIYPGRHTWEYWSRHFYDSLRFENRCFEAAR